MFEKIFSKNLKPLLFLDVDGVIAPLGYREGLTPLKWYGFNPSVNYDEQVVSQLLEYSEKMDCFWLTSWGDEAGPCFSRIGFQKFKEIEGKINAETLDWWKAELLYRKIKRKKPEQKVVWIDDELSYWLKEKNSIVQEILKKENILTISPDPRLGLMMNDLKKIEELILS